MAQYTSTNGPRVLVVDDAPEVLVLVRGILESEEFQVETAEDGAEAIQRLQQAPVDLILLDLDLPDIQGTALCRRWREEGSTTPILMLTSHNRDVERVAGLECGADDYLGKPFVPEELLARIRAHLRRQHAFRASAETLLRSQWERIEAGFRLAQRGLSSRHHGGVRHLPVGRIGGDFFLLEEVTPSRTYCVVADAMGKGLGACLVMSSALARTYELVHQGLRPQQILGALNQGLGEELAELGAFVAMFCGVLDYETGVFRFANAGLEPPVWLRPQARGRRHARLTTGGVPIGVVPGFEYLERRVSLAPGDQLFLFTDGLSESVSPEQQTPLMRLLYRLLLHPELSVEQKMERILEHLHPGERALRDDVTFMLLEYPGP